MTLKIKFPTSITIKKNVFDLILCVLLVLIFMLSVLFSFKFFNFSYIQAEANDNSTQKLTLSYDKLIEGNSSSNLAQYKISETNNRISYGDVCIKSKYIYFQKEKNNKKYLMKSSENNPSNEYPILEGYDISYINVSGNMLYFIGKESNSTEKNKIYMMGTEGENIDAIKTEFDTDISSLVTNSNYLYFTVEGNPNIYTVHMDGGKISQLACREPGGTDIRIFGIDKNYLYCVTGTACYKIAFDNLSVTKITDSCYSIYQSPLLTSDGILFYESLSEKDYMYVSKAGGPISKLFNKAQLTKTLSGQNIREVNYAEGYIFLVTTGNDIYYTKLGSSELKQLKGIMPADTGRVFFDNEYCVVEGDDILNSLNINWLLSA